MSITMQRYTVEEFEAFINLPENEDKLFELIAGHILEVSPNVYNSYLSVRIATLIMTHVRQNMMGFVTGQAGGYQIGNERYIPDVAFISSIKQPKLARDGYNPNPPDLAVEVVSPTDRTAKLTIKISNYLAAGTVVWVVYPDTREVQVHAPSQSVQVLTSGDTLKGGSVLPNFEMAVDDIFPADEDDND